MYSVIESQSNEYRTFDATFTASHVIPYIRAPPMEVIEWQSDEYAMSDATVHGIKRIITTVHVKSTYGKRECHCQTTRPSVILVVRVAVGHTMSDATSRWLT